MFFRSVWTFICHHLFFLFLFSVSSFCLLWLMLKEVLSGVRYELLFIGIVQILQEWHRDGGRQSVLFSNCKCGVRDRFQNLNLDGRYGDFFKKYRHLSQLDFHWKTSIFSRNIMILDFIVKFRFLKRAVLRLKITIEIWK